MSVYMWFHRQAVVHSRDQTTPPPPTKKKKENTTTICSPYPLESAQRLRWTVYAFLTFLLSRQSDCGDAARSGLVQGQSLQGPQLRRCAQRGGGEWQAQRLWGVNQQKQSLWLEYNMLMIESDKVFAISNIASVLLIISDPGEPAACFFTVQHDAGACSEIPADADKIKAAKPAERWRINCLSAEISGLKIRRQLLCQHCLCLWNHHLCSLEIISHYSPLYLFSGGRVRG